MNIKTSQQRFKIFRVAYRQQLSHQSYLSTVTETSKRPGLFTAIVYLNRQDPRLSTVQ